MASAESSAIAGLRTRGGAVDPGAATVVLLLLGAAIFLLIGCLQSTAFAQYTVEGLALGSVYGGLALALVLVYRATHIINFAQGELAMLTTYIAYQLMLWGLSYWLAFAATLAIAFALGTVLQVTLIRPVQRSVIAVVIVTVGLFILIDGIVNWIWGGDFKFMHSPFGNASFDVGGVAIQHLYVWMMGVVLVSVLLVWALFRFTKLGLGMRAAALRPAAAALVGVRVDSMLAIGWGLAAALGAVAGLMAEPSQLFLTPTLMQPILVYAFAAAVLGGLESPAGALVGGLAIGVTLTLIAGYQPHIGPLKIDSELQLPFAFAVLLLILLIRPQGLFGRRDVRRV
jgi:branched-chain amino acid transport system permease protein